MLFQMLRNRWKISGLWDVPQEPYAHFCPLTAVLSFELGFQVSLVTEPKIHAFNSFVPLPNPNLPEWIAAPATALEQL